MNYYFLSASEVNLALYTTRAGFNAATANQR